MSRVLRRSWAKFSLQTLMLATLLLAAVLGVLFHQARTKDQAIKSLKLVGVSVQSESYDLPWEIENYLPVTLVQRPISVEANPLAPQFDARFEQDREKWLQKELGLPPFRESDLRYLAPLRQLKVLSLTHAPVSDDGLVHLKFLHNLRELYLPNYSAIRSDTNPAISDMGLVHLQSLHKLEVLHLDGADISDSGLAELLPSLPNLQELYINRTAVSDESVLLLAELKKLKRLNLYGTRVTKTGKEQLRNLLPNCYIWHESDESVQQSDKFSDDELN